MIVDKVVLESGGIRLFAGRLAKNSEPRMYAELTGFGVTLDYLEEFVPLGEKMVAVRMEYALMVSERKISPAALMRYIEQKKMRKGA